MPCRQKRMPIFVMLRTLASGNACQLVLEGRNGLALNDMAGQGIVHMHEMEQRAAGCKPKTEPQETFRAQLPNNISILRICPKPPNSQSTAILARNDRLEQWI